MLRIGGACLLFACGLLLARALVGAEEDCVRQTEGFLLLLRHARTSISCFRTPLRDIWQSFENRALADCGFLSRLKRDGFTAALAAATPHLYLNKEELRLLTAFGCGIGKSRFEEQITLCNYTLERLEASYAQRVEEAPARRRTAGTLALTGALMLILILL